MKKIDLERIICFQGFVIFVLHCVRNRQVRLRMYIMKANCEVFKHKLNI